MYKKIISVMSVALVVFLCSFPVFAVTGGGKTIVSNSYSYNNGDVTVYVRVNGNAAEDLYEGQHYYPHNFTVTLANNTNEFQVADANNFSIDLYSGSASAFASNQNSWGAEVTSYSDNMTSPRITMYPSGDLAGHVLVAFNDSDLLVLNPNETRTYNFTVNFIQTENINYTPLNGNYRYSYFTYTGTVGFYARPASFSANTIEDFINNESLPNSAIAYYQYLIQLGIDDVDLLTNILTVLSNTYSSSYYTYNYGNTLFDYNVFYQQNNVQGIYYANAGSAIPVTNYFDVSDINSSNTSYSAIYDIPITLTYFWNNPTNDTYTCNNLFHNINIVPNFSNNGTQYLGYKMEVLNNNNFVINRLQNNYLILTTEVRDNYYSVIPSNTSSVITVCLHYYFGANGVNEPMNRPTISSVSITPPNLTLTKSNLNSTNIWNSLADIRAKIQYFINSYISNQPASEDLNDNSESASDTIDNQHETEANYFEDSQSAITDTGIQNFQFDSNTLGGLGGIKDDFTAVWTSCGTLSQYWIASLTIGLALSIIRHRRMFEK